MGVRFWVDLGDNRIGPLLSALAQAIEDTDDPETLHRLSSRLQRMSSSVKDLAREKE